MSNSENITYDFYPDSNEDREKLANLYEQISFCIKKAFGGEVPKKEIDRAFGRISVVANYKGSVVGFASLSRRDLSNLQYSHLSKPPSKGFYYHLSSLAVDLDYQNRGIGKKLNEFWIRQATNEHAPLITTFTQNKYLEKSISSVLDQMIEDKNNPLKSYKVNKLPFRRFYRRSLTESQLPQFGDLRQGYGDAYLIHFTLNY